MIPLLNTARERDAEPTAGVTETSDAERAGVTSAVPFRRSASEFALRPTPGDAIVLQRLAGNRATTSVLRAGGRLSLAGARMLSRLGYPLGAPLPASAPRPLKETPERREWKKDDFFYFWEAEQGRKLSDGEKKTVMRGCIGITANNLGVNGNPPLTEVYDDFDAAHAAMVTHNNTWWNRNVSTTKYVLFGILFWSNQDADDDKRRNPNPSAFVAKPGTHRIDMTGYRFRGNPDGVNFDFGYWDEPTSSFWHANHADPSLPGSKYRPDQPMIVYQSTRDKFAHRYVMDDGSFRYGYAEFDRVGYGLAVAENYDPTKSTSKGPGPPTPSGPPPMDPDNPWSMFNYSTPP